ncbi:MULTISPECIES: retropepsin-like aspartic protease [Pseudoalteromonas]|uniref:Clan AA aspartic protease, TIGR02281 family n=1 Tax=Pseudoalteromonas luteoviolacea (strain 2ta16) TaxID=1353533 RepID=V4HUX7_PSEL2|nr:MULTISPECIES: retropepsin-like aspartic protease [Pseudoalteromonas]ESP93588.1 clan AA aspartic protease, TIGR02281 family [Pseudoalteromonas luteoviolacea 2ta16]KZN34474.1 hypothetical protein N483_25090 [Pseudoalteromonas luteoviolacea NCIMB 1944]MCG7548708.1 TIGR02281 family clan AA aspartic protease [Pseudoalteromonas sp. Of7M-16]
MRYFIRFLLVCSLSLNVYLEWQRPHSLLKSMLFPAEPQQPGVSIDSMPAAPHTNVQLVKTHTPLELADQAFEAGDLLTAARLWHDSTNPTQQLNTVHAWLKKLRRDLKLKSEQQLASILLFVQRILAVTPKDFAALKLEADVYLAQGEQNEAIYRYIKLLHLYPEYQHLQDIVTALITQRLNHLKEHSDWHEIIAQGQIWLSEQPNNLPIIAAIIEAHLALNNPLEAELLLTQLSAQQQRHKAIAPLKDALENVTQQVERIPLERRGEHYVLKAQIAGQEISLMIDTGASITALTAAQFELLAYDVNYLNSRRVSTANGITEVPFYMSTGIQIGSKQKTPFEFGVMEQSHYGPGLLGMNFLRHFEFEIDQQQAELILKPR